MTLTQFQTAIAAHSHGLHCGGLQAVSTRLAEDHKAHRTAADVDELLGSLTEAALEAAQESAEYDAAWSLGYATGLAAFDKPMTAVEAANTLAGIVRSLHNELAQAA
jgi:hypothetical protein